MELQATALEYYKIWVANKFIILTYHKVPTGFRYVTSGRNTWFNAIKCPLELAKRHSYKIHKFDHIQDYIVTDSYKIHKFDHIQDYIVTHSYKIHKFDHIQDYIVTDSNKDILNYVCL